MKGGVMGGLKLLKGLSLKDLAPEVPFSPFESALAAILFTHLTRATRK